MQHGTLWQLFHKTLVQQPINIESKRAWSESYGPCWLAHYFYHFSNETKENLGGNHPNKKKLSAQEECSFEHKLLQKKKNREEKDASQV